LSNTTSITFDQRRNCDYLAGRSFPWLVRNQTARRALATRVLQSVSLPVLVRLSVAVSQLDLRCSAEALITVTDSLDVAIIPAVVNARGLPGYTFERAGGELWCSRFDAERNLIVVNNGHRDFVFATRSRAPAALSCAALCQGVGA
jgi:hypothetical protein